MENLQFRKELIKKEIESLTSELKNNQEFINLFLKNNNEILERIRLHYTEVEQISCKLEESK